MKNYQKSSGVKPGRRRSKAIPLGCVVALLLCIFLFYYLKPKVPKPVQNQLYEFNLQPVGYGVSTASLLQKQLSQIYSGRDVSGKVYQSIDQYIKLKGGDIYQAVHQKYAKKDSSMKDMTGGDDSLNAPLTRDSDKFLKEALGEKFGEPNLTVLDVGCGLGRVSKYLLLKYFAQVDLLEPVKVLLDQAQIELNGLIQAKLYGKNHIDQIFNLGWQQFTPDAKRYDVVWDTWTLMYMTDEDIIASLQRMKDGLKPNGFIVIHENINDEGNGFVGCHPDICMLRSEKYMNEIFTMAGYKVEKMQRQTGMPLNVYRMTFWKIVPVVQ